MKISLVRRAALLGISALGVAGCEWRVTYQDVSLQERYKSTVGVQYRVIGILHAYGIRKHSSAPVHEVILIPPPGIAGSQIAFKELIGEGSMVKINKVLLTNRVFDPRLTLEVKISAAAWQTDVPIYVDLMRGNESSDGLTLNPAVYQRLEN